MKEKDRLFGQTVVDFVNSKTPEEACIKHFENIQQLMGFSSDFSERLKEDLISPSLTRVKGFEKAGIIRQNREQEIKNARRSLRDELEMIVCGKPLREIYIEPYNADGNFTYQLSGLKIEDDLITEVPPISEEEYMGDTEDINRDLIYCLVNFLKSNDRRKIKKCPYCDKFFIAKDIKRKRCYSDDCRKEYERNKKRKQREDEPGIYC